MPTSDAIMRAQAVLASLSPEEAYALIERTEDERHKNYYIKYWQPYSGGNQPDVFRKFTADKKIFGVLGGNRSGKTETGAAIAVAWALGKEFFRDSASWEWVKDLPIPEPPNTVWIVGLDFNMVRDVLWREKLRSGKNHPGLLPVDPALVAKTNDSDFQAFFTNGSIITCKSADSGREKFQAASVDLVWIDEECEVEVFDECYQRTSDCAGKILITLTPLTDISSGTRTPWVFDLYCEWKEGKQDLAFVTLSVLDNPYVPEDEKLKLKEHWSGHFEERARLYGEFVQRSGLVYNMWDPAKHLIKPIDLPRHWRRLACIDPAATGTTACIWCAVHPGGDLYFYREYYSANQIVSEHAKNILARTTDHIDLWLIDPKWGTQRNAETHKTNQQLYRDAGIPVRLAEVGEDYGLNASREYLFATTSRTSSHPRAYFFDDLTNFRYEVEHYVWDFFHLGEQKGLSKDKPRKKNDHLLNAMQYIMASRPRGGRDRGDRTEAERFQAALVNSYTIPA